MASIYKAVLLFGNIDLDTGDTPQRYIWGNLISQNPKDDEGNPVRNPGGLMVYNAKGISPGDCEEVLLRSRGVGGLYDLIPAEAASKVLEKLGITMEDLDEVPVVESASTSVDRKTARENARKRRQERSQRRAQTTANPEEATAM